MAAPADPPIDMTTRTVATKAPTAAAGRRQGEDVMDCMIWLFLVDDVHRRRGGSPRRTGWLRPDPQSIYGAPVGRRDRIVRPSGTGVGGGHPQVGSTPSD